jgi:hypothetical protein
MGNPDMFYPGKSAPQDPDAARDRFLAATVAFGHPGFLLTGREGELRSYYMIQALASLYTQSSADTIEYADADGVLRDTSSAVATGVYSRSQVVTRYADGTLTAVNGNTRHRLRTAIDGTVIDLPPNGYWGRSSNGTVRVFSGDLNGRRADLSVCPAYTYVDGRGTFARFPEGASAGVAICLALTNGLAEVLLHKTAEAGFPLSITEATALAQDNKDLGPAEVRVARGLSYVRPVAGAFSYRIRHTGRPPASPLACDVDQAPPGERLTVRGSAPHEVLLPPDAQPGTRVWQTFEGAWIDFTVSEPATLSATVEGDTLAVRPVSRFSVPRPARLLCQGVEHPFTLEPGANAPQRLTLPPGAVQTGAVSFALHFDPAGSLAPVAGTLTRRRVSHALPLPANRVAGMRLRGKPETALDTAATGAQLHTASSTCGGLTKAKALFMHPPYRDGVGHTFARYALTLPEQPLIFRCAVGKQDGSDPGDGILFRVVVEDAQGERTEIASQTVTAHAWHALEGTLTPWAGQRISLLLITDVGEKDNSSGDWGVWGDLCLEPPEPSYEWK